MINRTLLLWAIATRRQLERWETHAEEYLRATFANETPHGQVIWDANIEHHFLLIACRNLVMAIDKFKLVVSTDQDALTELRDVRDLVEHWDENMPIFNVSPRQADPKYRSGKRFAERNPERSPYWWLYWNSIDGHKVTINVSAQTIFDLVDEVQDAVLSRDIDLVRFVPIDWLPET